MGFGYWYSYFIGHPKKKLITITFKKTRDPFTISDDGKIEYMRNIENKEIENTYSRLTTLEKYKNNMNSERILMKEEEIECSNFNALQSILYKFLP